MVALAFMGWHLLSPTMCYVKVISLSSHPNCTVRLPVSQDEKPEA